MNKYIDQVTGPVIPLPVPFLENEEVAYEALGNYVNFLMENGIKNVMTTVGTSRYNLLTHEECKRINETVVQAAAGRGVTIVANPTTGGTKQAVAFAEHAEQIGADLYLAYYPERHYGEEYIHQFFQKISDATDVGVLIHEMPMRNGRGGGTVQYSLPLLQQLLELENVVGLKEEALDAEYSNILVETLHDKALIIGAGGGMSRYLLRDHDRGARAYLGGIGNFYPQLEIDFYEAMINGDKSKAAAIVNNIELPYFEKVVPMGWHPSLKAALALKGLMPAYERSPMKQIAGEELTTLEKILQDNGWL